MPGLWHSCLKRCTAAEMLLCKTISPMLIPIPQADTPHLLLPFAASADLAALASLQALPAENTQYLRALLAGMARHTQDGSPASDAEQAALSLSPPHERALARGLGLAVDATADGLIPWAALARLEASPAGASADGAQAWALVTPCHWAMGREHATLTDPEALGLSEAESRTLLAAMQPYCEEDSITLHYLSPERWLAAGEVFRGLPTASLDRVLGRDVDRWLPAGLSGKLLRRLQNEMQMLLYTHPVNEARALHRQLPVNSLWFSGTGDLPTGFDSAHSRQMQEKIQAPRSLAQAAMAGDWAAYGAAWAELDATHGRELLARQNAGETVQLTLCGERAAQTWVSAPPSLGLRIKRGLPFLFSPRPLWAYLENL
jgi:hypothetical protein